MSGDKAHPAYSAGYFDGLEGYPMQGQQPPEYEAGYGAGARAAEIFESAGMERQDDGSFSVTLTIPAQGDAPNRQPETPRQSPPQSEHET
jgi:hypothetical protein